MKNFYTRDQLTVYIITSRFMLDALSNWAKEASKKYTLDQHLWNILKDHFSAHFSVYSIDHVQSLFSDFRNQESDRLVSQRNRCGQVLEVGLRYMANTYFEWRHGNPMIRQDKVLQVQHWLAECNPEPIQCYLWTIDYGPSRAGEFGDFTNPHHRQLSEEALRVLLHGPLLSAVDDPTVQRLHREGLAEIHRHLNGTILPSLLWSYLIHAPQRLSPKSLAGNLDGLKGHDCIALLRTAGDLRAALIWRLHKQYVTQTWNKERKQPDPEKQQPAKPEPLDQDCWNSEVLERLKYPYEVLPVRFQDFVTFKISGCSHSHPQPQLPFDRKAWDTKPHPV